MASTVAGGLFNALAFAGAGFLFSKLNHNGYEEEIKRHNKAIEDLAKAKEKWYEQQVEKKNKLAQLRRELNDAKQDMVTTNKALNAIKRVTQEMETSRQPVLDDYYEPSEEMKRYQTITVGTVGLSLGAAIAKFIL